MISIANLPHLAEVKSVKNLTGISVGLSEDETRFNVYFSNAETDYTFDADGVIGYGGIVWEYEGKRAYKLNELVPQGESFSFQHVHRYLDFIIKAAPFADSIELRIYKDCAYLNVDGVVVSLDGVYDDNALLRSIFPQSDKMMVVIHPEMVQQIENLKECLL